MSTFKIWIYLQRTGIHMALLSSEIAEHHRCLDPAIDYVDSIQKEWQDPIYQDVGNLIVYIPKFP